MKGTAALLLLALVVGPVGAASLSPVTRVVELLKGLTSKIEEDGKKEEDLYETYVCWAKTVIDTKTSTNSAAESRIGELGAYIADIEAGRVEFTSERANLEKELEGLNAEMEAAKDLRDKENADFLEAEDEMNKAIKALEKAGEVLGEATEGHEEGELIELNGGAAIGEGFSQRQADARSLAHAVELGEKFLTKGDSLFLRKLLTGDVPDVDWKKLNRKATFKMSYKARSFKIQDLLAKLLATFKGNLKDATAKEEEAKDNYDKLMEAKGSQKTKCEDALASSEEETGARGMAKEDAQAEFDALTTQVENDKKFIEQTTTALAEKKEEWKVRSALRSGELAAISKAISTLASDDARDLMKKSFASQGLFFLQVDQQARAGRGIHAADVIRRAGASTRDIRLSALAATVSSRTGGHFDEVISAIDKMVELLNKEEAKDKETKEMCEKDRMDDARTAAVAARTIDEHSEAIMKLEAEIVVIKQEIADRQEQIKTIEGELKDAQRIRDDQHKEWKQTDKDDKAAAEVVASAQGVLEDFYKENGLGLVQKKIDPVVAGEAPPPPPTTWDAPYGGAKGESQGIIAILGMVKEDIEKDQAKAKAEEDLSQKEFDEFKSESEAQIKDLGDEISDLEGTQGEKEESVKDNKVDRKTQKEELDSVMQKMKDALSGCDFMTINYPMRMKNRQTEIDGLDKAKAILEGAAFGSN